MLRHSVAVASIAALAGLTAACGASTPLAPVPPSGSTGSAADGSTLKVTAPSPQSPVNDQHLTTAPVLTASAATPTFGSNANLQYRFQVYSASGQTVVDSGLINGTSYPVSANLTGNTRYTWRARAEYQGGIGPWSSTASFVTPVPFDMTKATIWDNPQDVAYWDVTTHITDIDTSSQIVVDFDKRQSPDKWPESGFGTGGIQYTLGMCANLSNGWNCSAVVQFWDGRDLEAGGVASEVGLNWFYDLRWGALLGYQPAQGEVVGMWVAQGNLRDSGNTSLKERSDVVMIPWGGSYHRQ